MFSLQSTTENDPMLMATWRKVAMVIVVSLAAYQGNFAAGAHLIAFEPMAEYYHCSITAIANTIGIGILGVGIGSLLWSPLSSPTGLGRRNTFLLAWGLYVPITLWLCFAKSLESFSAARFISMFCASVAQTVPAQQIGETFDKKYKGTAVSTWALLMTLGPVSTPLIGAGLLMINPGPLAFRNIYYFVAVTSAAMWVLIFFFVPETAYLRPISAVPQQQPQHMQKTDSKEVEFDDAKGDIHHFTASSSAEDTTTINEMNPNRSRLSTAPWYQTIPLPVLRFFDGRVLICALMFAITFGWTVGMTIINPQVFFAPPWKFNSVQVGGLYMSAFVGAIFGKLLGGYLIDISLIYWRRKTGVSYAEQRLWGLLITLPIGIVGLLCYGFGIGKKLQWEVSIIGGQALAYMYFNIVSSIVQTYLVEVEPASATPVISFMNLAKCVFSFGIPFFVPAWALASSSKTGFQTSFIIQMIVNVVICLANVSLALFLRNGLWKKSQARQAMQSPNEGLALQAPFLPSLNKKFGGV